jgi:myo-inositol catabolism protein IolC
VIEFDRKHIGLRSIPHPDVTEEIIEHPVDHVVRIPVCIHTVDRVYLRHAVRLKR